MESLIDGIIKMVRGVLGETAVKLLAWIVLLGTGLWLAPDFVDRFDRLADRFGGTAITWGAFLEAGFALALVAAIFAVIFAMYAMVLKLVGRGEMGRLREDVDALRVDVDALRADVAAIKSHLGIGVDLRLPTSASD